MAIDVAKAMESLAGLSVSFLPIIVIIVLVLVFGHADTPRPDFSFLVTALFTDAAWRCRKLPATQAIERYSGVLVGAIGAVISGIAAILLLLAELKVLEPQTVLAAVLNGYRITLWAFIPAVAYSCYVRYKTL